MCRNTHRYPMAPLYGITNSGEMTRSIHCGWARIVTMHSAKARPSWPAWMTILPRTWARRMRPRSRAALGVECPPPDQDNPHRMTPSAMLTFLAGCLYISAGCGYFEWPMTSFDKPS